MQNIVRLVKIINIAVGTILGKQLHEPDID